jgi:hypothetical protein
LQMAVSNKSAELCRKHLVSPVGWIWDSGCNNTTLDMYNVYTTVVFCHPF